MNNGPDMRMISRVEMDEFFHQAVDRDYKENDKSNKNSYTRGHVFPNQYAADQYQADSTFTFTNIAPQTQHSNGEWAAKVETPMQKIIKNKCNPNRSNLAFIVTGVVPGNNWIAIRRHEKHKMFVQGINIPSFYWTAFCCYSNQTTTISGAYLIRQNEPNKNSYERSHMSVDMLNKRLSTLYKQVFKVFGDLCLTSVQSEFVPSDSLV